MHGQVRLMANAAADRALFRGERCLQTASSSKCRAAWRRPKRYIGDPHSCFQTALRNASPTRADAAEDLAVPTKAPAAALTADAPLLSTTFPLMTGLWVEILCAGSSSRMPTTNDVVKIQ